MQNVNWIEMMGRLIPPSLYAPAVVAVWMLVLWLTNLLSLPTRYRKEGIQIPYPTRSVELSKKTLQGLKSS